MADNPTMSPATQPQRRRHASEDGNQVAPRRPWAPSSSADAYVSPSPTKDTQDRPPLILKQRPPSMPSKPQNPCDISNLMSPPEPAPLDMYSPPATASRPLNSPGETRLPHPPLSPPVSPSPQASSTVTPAPPEPPPNLGGKDPILYPAIETPPSAPKGPLFTPIQSSVENFRETTERLVSEHIASRPADLFRGSTPPRPEDYELALYFKSNCFRMFQDNPKEWLRKERELLRADRKHVALSSQPAKLPRILPATRPVPALRPPVLGPQTAKGPVSRVRKAKSPPKAPAPNPPRPIRATPAPSRGTIHVGTPEPRVRTVAPNREDKDFAALEDLSPPLSTLPAKSNSLKVDWKGNALDLSNDPHRHMLHPDELMLASNLRLDCATYLTSKRRIFLRRLECARIGKEFRKTDAQQACKIDVNKASKLWQAYEKVGWLDIKWMQSYLTRDR